MCLSAVVPACVGSSVCNVHVPNREPAMCLSAYIPAVRLCAVRVRVLGGPDTDREHDAGRTSASVCACRLECGCVPCQLAVDTSTSTPTDSPTRAPLCIILAACVC